MAQAVGKNHPTKGKLAPVSPSCGRRASWPAGGATPKRTARASSRSIRPAEKVVLEIYAERRRRARSTTTGWRAAPTASGAGSRRVPAKTLYGFRAWGPNWPFDAGLDARQLAPPASSPTSTPAGNRFDPNKVLFDPYAPRALATTSRTPAMVAAGETSACTGRAAARATRQVYTARAPGKVAIDRRNVDTGRCAPKGIALVDATSFGTGRTWPQRTPSSTRRTCAASPSTRRRHPPEDILRRHQRLRAGRERPEQPPRHVRGRRADGALPQGARLHDAIELLPIQETDNDATPPRGPAATSGAT